ncbi:MAG: type II toxin-antitoxin system RelE/ParE family toxin [Pusillimonas sp.]|nr:type II toxin-antitoxin system mRNA interferase toxin, RelE/StbE family [Pusillimonas sp.]MBC41052.1 type II toxin-antitoxin system mRNA interferase toxin, RelE/StbE family [Pusillimonas sp.]MBC7203292.1 type II toxin-antitoxin system RelE/ParE family toxin [Pusillimonas sp.]HCN73326.1 type II toxin-antitoxin system mRNA interferase toxin, RelE/StbE family [Pusillimonas sp.]HCP77360.1 type II toxin-antitoxin system mRNA interferase toxin, RelE/StbE family [Pusillimonas sp.]|tara:strand:- start:414 stop:680 length:267 start_codon:yes stop_codon:yes gene_type:complete
MALADRERIAEYIADEGSPVAARKLDAQFVDKAHTAAQRPMLYRAGRIPGTREVVVRPNFVMIYRIENDGIEVLRVLHAAQQWPPEKL